jgi:hypothetical protein
VGAFPWKLRLQHLGGAGVKVEHPEGILVFDPGEVPDEGAVVVLTRSDALAVRGTLEAVRAGRRPRVIADERMLHWLSRQGAISGDVIPLNVDGMALAALTYVESEGPLQRAVRAVRSPAAALRRARIGFGMPSTPAFAVEVTFPSGARLVHLGRALHDKTDQGWIDRAAKRFAGVDWLIAGVEPGAHDAYQRHVVVFSATRTLVGDLVSDPRGAFKPAKPVTPIVDRLMADAREAYVFSNEASLRFE